MKDEYCDGCRKILNVEAGYEPQYCCNGDMCGCAGLVVNPVFCDDCERILTEEVNSWSGKEKM